jgi:predicted amidohydrolase
MKAGLLMLLVACAISLPAQAGTSDNLVANPGFEEDRDRDGWPDGWKSTSPDEVLRPVFERETGGVRSGQSAMAIRAASDRGATHTSSNGAVPLYKFGYVYQDVPVEKGATYEFIVRCRTEGLDNPNRSVLVNLVWGGEGHYDNFLSEWTARGDWLEGRQKFRHRHGDVVRLMLMFRHEGTGGVVFDDIEVRRAEPDAPRVARVASYPALPKGQKDNPRARAEQLVPHIARAKKEGCDIICLTEGINKTGPALKIAEPLNGPTCTVLAKAAADNQIYVIAGVYERDGDYVYNSAVLFDRQGKIAGKYRKTHLHWPEMFEGTRPGSDFPVFKCDFGTIGIIICYDSWFPETSRLLGLKGAEIIFCPNAGYHEICAEAAACNTGAYFVSSSGGGTLLKNVFAAPDFKQLAYGGPDLLVAEMNLSEPKPYAYYQSQTCGMPQSFRQMRHRISDRVLEEIAELYRSVPKAPAE